MGRTYDLIERLKSRNERPMVILDEDHKYPINTSKTNVLCIMAYIRKVEKQENEAKGDDTDVDERMTDQLIKMAIGEKALEYINSQNYTLAAVSDIVEVIMAAIKDEDVSFEENEKESKKEKK